jgi:hypothetical protein
MEGGGKEVMREGKDKGGGDERNNPVSLTKLVGIKNNNQPTLVRFFWRGRTWGGGGGGRWTQRTTKGQQCDSRRQCSRSCKGGGGGLGGGGRLLRILQRNGHGGHPGELSAHQCNDDIVGEGATVQ